MQQPYIDDRRMALYGKVVLLLMTWGSVMCMLQVCVYDKCVFVVSVCLC